MGWFKPKEEKPQWLRLVEFFEAQAEGYIGETAGLELIVECVPGALAAIVGQANKKLADSGVRFTSVRGVGYRRATPAECLAESATRRPRWIAAGTKRAEAAALSVVNSEDATDDERKRASDVAAVHRDHLRVLRKQRAVLKVHAPELPVMARSYE
jgi:hypothetical protein